MEYYTNVSKTTYSLRNKRQNKKIPAANNTKIKFFLLKCKHIFNALQILNLLFNKLIFFSGQRMHKILVMKMRGDLWR